MVIKIEDIKVNNYYVGSWTENSKVIFMPTDNSLYRCHFLNSCNFFMNMKSVVQ